MQWLNAVRNRCARYTVSLLLLAALTLVGAIWQRGVDLRMHEIIQTRLRAMCYPVAVSMMYHGGAPYVMYAEVQERLLRLHAYLDYSDILGPAMDHHTAFNNGLLDLVAATPPADPTATKLVTADDLGMVDIILLSFLLFGTNVHGIFTTLMLVMLGTVLVFFAAFRDRPACCMAPCLVLGAVYAAMPALLLTQEAFSFTNPRVLDIIGIIPITHLILATLHRQRMSWLRLAAAGCQVLVLVECVHIRSSTMWMVFCLVGLYLILLATRVAYRDPAGRWPDRRFRAILRSGWLVALLIAGLGGLKVYQRAVYDPGYRTSNLEHHVFWHNVGPIRSP
jgi:hypothetical protein